MSALIAAAAKGPAINRVVFSAAPRVLATLLRLQIPVSTDRSCLEAVTLGIDSYCGPI